MKWLRKWFPKIVRYGLIAFATVFLFSIVINLWVIWGTQARVFTNVNDVPRSKVALLLGTSPNTARGKNVFFMHRIRAAADLYKAGKVKKIIVSGDNSVENYNETKAMRRELVKLGVPNSAIVNDHAGFRTLDSVVRAKSVFDQSEVVIVSQKFHIQRGIYIADAKGIKATGYVAKDPPHGNLYFRIMFREYFARVKAFLDCYILGTDAKFPGPKEPIRF